MVDDLACRLDFGLQHRQALDGALAPTADHVTQALA
jgi:hypothetical protein